MIRGMLVVSLLVALFATLSIVGVRCAKEEAEVEEEEGVIVMTQDNFEFVLEEHEHILVEFYAPWCGHCKHLAPEYAKAAAALSESGSSLKLGKVDVTVHGALASSYDVKGYPTLKLFSRARSEPVDYQGARTSAAIIAWMKKKTGPVTKELKKTKELEAFKTEADVVAIAYFKSTDQAKTFTDIAYAIDDVPFGVVFDEKVAKAGDLREGVITLFKHAEEDEDDKRIDYDPVVEGKKWVQANRLAAVTEFTQDTAAVMFSGEIKSFALMFISKKSSAFAKSFDAFKAVAKEFREKMIFTYVNMDTDDSIGARLLELCGVSNDELPTICLLNVDGDLSKFKANFTALTSKNIRKFVDDFIQGKLKPDLKSEEIPSDWDEQPVKVLVGKNFADVALDPSKNVLVEFYAPWCGHCKTLAPIWDLLGEKFKDHANVVIAKMDSMENEVEGVKIQGYPTIKFFPAGSNEIVDYDGDRTFEAIADFLRAKLAKRDSDDDEKPKQKQPTCGGGGAKKAPPQPSCGGGGAKKKEKPEAEKDEL